MPRESHAEFDPPADRPDQVALLEQQAESRVPELVPIRYGRMLVSPFAYYRGAALPMASDFAGLPCTGLVVQACTDAHLSNFGIFASPERKFLFDVNDFDETLPGPWEWDVKRLAARLEVAARGNSFSRKQRRRIVTASTRCYLETMRAFARLARVERLKSRGRAHFSAIVKPPSYAFGLLCDGAFLRLRVRRARALGLKGEADSGSRAAGAP